MKYFSTFSGIGGFELGIKLSGIKAECVGYSEIDKYASSIYNYQFSKHLNYGDITNINESKLPDFELFVGGFPCQAFSIAGKRQGFEDTRGTLFFDVARILSAKRPKRFILENVKGLLNHDNGRTIGTIFRVLTELGYSVGWEVVNSCQFGVPQNRERIFIIGCLGKQGIGEIFPIGENIEGVVKRRNEHQLVAKNFQGKDIDNTVRAGGLTKKHNWDIVKVGTLRTHKDGEGFRELESGLCPTIPARARQDGSGQPVIKVKEATKEGYSEATFGDSINYSVPASKTRRGRVGKGIANTLDTSVNQGVVVKAVLTPERLEKRQNGRRFKDNEEPSFTLTSQDKHGVQIDERIRRLTPIECERLQGFPDDWTKFGLFDGEKKEISDTQRYKTLGNAVTVNVIEAIINKIYKK
ncbi:MAG: DNA (cytosine-5-)-methyltransferase [Balneola sp.]